MLGYISSFFPSWTTVGSYMGLYWTCSTICILKAIFSVFWALLTAMIVPVWMVKYMAAAVIVLTMLSNVLELVPFVMSWGYLGISYFIVWTFCYVSIWSVCRQSQYTLRNSSSRGTTPSRDAVTGEVLLLSDLTDTFLLAHKFFLGEIVLCCIICSILELERNR